MVERRVAQPGGPPERRVSPRGEEFEVAGPAAPVELMGAPPIPAEARAELLVLKSGGTFLCARPDGDIRARAASGEGLYAHDTRHLSELRLALADAQPVLLSHSVDSGHRAVVNATNPDMRDAGGVSVPQETLNIRRTLLVADRLYCSLELRSYCPGPVTVPLSLSLAADFADVFEVRGVRRRAARGRAMVPNVEAPGAVVFGYEGEDGLFRDTLVELDPAPSASEVDGERAHLRWEVALEPGEVRRVLVTVLPSSGERRPPRRPFEVAAAEQDRDLERWVGECARIETDNELVQSVVAASIRDMHALLMPVRGVRMPVAGIPWFAAPFGRDALVSSYECLLLNPRLARDTLIVLAALQADADEPWRDAEPGKILHELREGELARAGLVPHTPYYGTVDATPLFVMLAAAYWRWTADLETLSALRPALDAALEWIDRYGDGDGDGFVEYERRSPAGLLNQGWKDSDDALVHADGTLAQGPIALVEVQGYVFLAKLRIADVYDALGEPDRARALRAEAEALRAAFNEAFWNEEEGTFALALDGRKRQVASVTSNPGHCLYCGIVVPDKAAPLAERLMAPDMFSGWGVRTLSAQSPAYNPMSYHNGSVWPHDNAIVAAGLKRYGFGDAALRIATALFDVAARARDRRLPELFCGFERGAGADVVGYPVACMPQAWAAAAPFMLLQATLGITAHAPTGTLGVIEPRMPDWLGRVELDRVRVGEASVKLAFTQVDGVTTFSLLEQQGDVAVTLTATPR
ncbi:MAG: amylo-alpha-1,6-glucosidase [Thermoleophilaceae bacterium]|nr:amylo-alpha-1,6-glucosidase [Thermoleophilaceae bacterium]